MPNSLTLLPGKSYPLGATVQGDGVNFSLFSKYATSVELLLFDSDDHSRPSHVLVLNREQNKTFYYWHCFISGIRQGQLYGYRVYGPFDPKQGMRFDGNKVLVDPYARAVVSHTYDREAAKSPGDNCAQAMKSVVIDPQDYDWEGDQPLNHSFDQSVIYELHVGGFTRHPNSGVSPEKRGTYAGLAEKIPYLKSLGVTAVELLPVQQFDPTDAPTGVNYWGYSPVAFFAPHNGYCSCNDPVVLINEFRDMVKAFHKAGIEIILDVVFNHTAEGDMTGPTLSFRGLENMAYYMLPADDMSRYANFTGTGNTINANHSIVRRMIRDCLRHWAAEMHIDGFRFDLASVLSRGEDGHPLENPPLLWEIESDPVLAPTKIIAEAWDLQAYQVGNFVGDKWAEWNGKYRDDVRRFIRGDEGMVVDFAQRLAGSQDLFRVPDRNPSRSINFITCHDGFTLNDLVSFNEKHNWMNGENNQDGTDANYSWNCGIEGPSDSPEIDALRERQVKNFFTVLMVSQGTPMLLSGDEVRRTQFGNNNAYCQDNTVSWFDWDLVEHRSDLLEFVKKIIRFNRATDFFREDHFWKSTSNHHGTSVTWHGTKLGQPDWGHFSHSIAFTLHNAANNSHIHAMVNAYRENLVFELPPFPSESLDAWHRIVDTALSPPYDIFTYEEAPLHSIFEYEVKARSVVVLQAKEPR